MIWIRWCLSSFSGLQVLQIFLRSKQRYADGPGKKRSKRDRSLRAPGLAIPREVSLPLTLQLGLEAFF
jgi:hypothetical protein